MNAEVTVHKLDEHGRETFAYRGRLLERAPHAVRVEAEFGRQEIRVGDLVLRPGDRFVETFYSDRWYNVFEVWGPDRHRRKGWYCNVARPARIEAGHIYQDDLALDLVVYPDGSWQVFDEDEFERLDLPEGDRRQARLALQQLIELAEKGEDPFVSPD